MRDDNRLLAPQLLAAALALHAAPAAAAGLGPVRRILRIRDRLDDRGAVALTFDDGPHPEGTPAVLEWLDRHGLRATFFLVGEQVARRPKLAAEIVMAGHEAAIHCQLHRNLLRLGPRRARDDLLRAEATISEAVDATPLRHRPPYGYYTSSSLILVRKHGLEPVLWARDGRDWEARATPESIARRLGRRLRGGEVLLLHDSDAYSAEGSWRRTVGALPLLLERLEERGLRVAPLDRLPPPNIDRRGRARTRA